MWSNIKNCCWRTFVIKKQKNLHFAGRWWSQEVARYVPTELLSINRLVSKIKQTKVTQEVVSPEVSKLNHTAMNKKQEDQIPVFSRKNKLGSSTNNHTSRWIVVIDSLVLLGLVSFVSKCLSCYREKKSGWNEMKIMGI